MVHSASECAIPVGRVNRYNVALHGAHVGNRSIILLKGPEFAHLFDGVRVKYLYLIPFVSLSRMYTDLHLLHVQTCTSNHSRNCGLLLLHHTTNMTPANAFTLLRHRRNYRSTGEGSTRSKQVKPVLGCQSSVVQMCKLRG